MKLKKTCRYTAAILCILSQLCGTIFLASCGKQKQDAASFSLSEGDTVVVYCENDALSAPCQMLNDYLTSALSVSIETEKAGSTIENGKKVIRWIAPGNTDYSQSLPQLHEYDGCIGCFDHTLVLCASCEEGGQLIVDRLKSSLGSTGELTVSGGEWLTESYPYAFRSMTINGTDIADFSIVTLSGALPRRSAESLQNGIRFLCGITLPLITDPPKDLSDCFVIGTDALNYGSNLGAYEIKGTTVTVDGKSDRLSTAVSYMLHDICQFSETPDPQSADLQIQKEGVFPITDDSIEDLPNHLLYISSSGNDKNSGAEGSPLATVDGAFQRALQLRCVSPAPVSFKVDADCSPANGVSTEAVKRSMTDAQKNAVKEYLPGIICWGDSLTYGTVSTYRKSLSDAILTNIADGIEVLNRGCGGETSLEIVARSGAIPYETTRDVTYTPGKSSLYLGGALSIGGTLVHPIRQYCGSYLYGKNTVSCSIQARMGDMNGLLYYQEGGYYFQPKPKPETEITLPEGTEIIAVEQTEYEENYLPIVFIGANGGYQDSSDKLIEQIHAILSRYRKADESHDRYLVISAHTGSRLDNAELENALSAEFGSHYLNLREQLSVYGPIDLGIPLTEERLNAMENGIVIPELLSDNIHFSAEVYGWVGKLIFNKLSSLGYFNEITAASEGSIG